MKQSNKRIKQISGIRIWSVVLIIYLFLISAIGYIAFWEQDFNNPDKFLAKYENIRNKHFEVDLKAFGSLERDQRVEDFSKLIQESMETAADSAGDLQELITQSFNILLGAFLAFLSATTSIVFQSSNPEPKEKKNDGIDS